MDTFLTELSRQIESREIDPCPGTWIDGPGGLRAYVGTVFDTPYSRDGTRHASVSVGGVTLYGFRSREQYSKWSG